MDLKELDYIVTVADEGSISRAAEKLFMAQSSLSQAVRLIEQDLGTSVFVRTARGVRLTAAGEAFISHARQILQQYREARSEASDIENLKGGTIIFGISTYRGTYLLPPVLKKFHERYPKVHVEISEMDSIDLENQILEGILDLALIAAPPVRIKHGFEELMRDEIMLVTTKEHPVMKYAHECENDPEELWIDLKDTAPYEYILGPPNTVLGRTARPFSAGSRCGTSRTRYIPFRGVCGSCCAGRCCAGLYLPVLPDHAGWIPVSADRKRGDFPGPCTGLAGRKIPVQGGESARGSAP